MVARAKELGIRPANGARGFVFNAQPTQGFQFLDIGTVPQTSVSDPLHPTDRRRSGSRAFSCQKARNGRTE